LESFDNAALKYNMMISSEKTKTLVISRTPLKWQIKLNNSEIEQVNSFKYLGADINDRNDLYDEVSGQVRKASAISGCLKDCIWKNKHMSIKSKTKIYKTCVRPVMTYGIETRADTVRTKALLRTSEMRILRCITGKTLRDRIRNTEIRRMCEAEDIVRWGRQRRRGWRDHVNRMDTNRLPHIVSHGKPSGSRPRGRPPKRWRDSWQSTSQEVEKTDD
jgi:hypothetical protein